MERIRFVVVEHSFVNANSQYCSAVANICFYISIIVMQVVKLWDVRRMKDRNSVRQVSKKYLWDYRGMDYPGNKSDRYTCPVIIPFRYQTRYSLNFINCFRHPNDQSLLSFSGHEVLRTLVRCRFSPAATTGL